MYGWDPQQVIGNPIENLTVPLTEQEHASVIMEKLRNGEFWRGDFKVKRNDGTEFMAAISNTPFFDNDGNLKGIIGVSRDITERLQRENELNAQKERLSMAQQVAKIGSWKTDLRTLDVEWSDETYNLFEVDQNSFKPNHESFLTFVHPDDRDAVDEALKQSIHTTESQSIEHRIIGAQGTEKTVVETWRIERSENGEPLFAFGTCQDISLRKRSEMQLERLNEQLSLLYAKHDDELEEERLRISREIHDQLGQYLTVLKMDTWKIKEELAPQNQKANGIVENMLQRIDESVEIVRRISRELRPLMLDEMGLVAAMAWHCEEFQRHTGIQTELRSDTEELNISEDAAIGLFRIMQESCTNVARHAKASKLQVRLMSSPEQLSLEMQDDGVGMNVEELDLKGHLGILGMTERAKIIGATVSFDSEPGNGTTVRILLPTEQLK